MFSPGNGKGKSTAAFGTATRAVGHGKTVGVAQFIKGQWDNGEYNTLQPLGVEFHIMGTGFTWGDTGSGSGYTGGGSRLAGRQAHARRPALRSGGAG
ncbi:cob(I)yrinic acid a,c-diamide adenosyltransferase [Citrobacter koseri]|uniref:corrinoid adenosyltransferase n=1 Tax=Citrobacter koseri TaxID=545 RepID=A0A2X2V760_CITKO|nr:cob(I)yrinic acid a,c-diamide adenosyltransferase [Citrobacter koseri]